MMRLTNTNGKRVGYVCFDMSDGETSTVMVLRVLPAVGYLLQATPADADFVFESRETGSGDPWADLSTGLDLSGYPPEVAVDFDFRVTTGAPLTDVRRIAVRLEVASQGAAAWS